MGENDSRSLDILGIKPIGDTIKVATQAAVDGASAFLSRICLPAAEEFGLALRDRVSVWRQVNMVAIVKAAEKKLASRQSVDDAIAHPRIVGEIIENGSWIDDVVVQDMWAGLLASSCSTNGDDDSNLLFVNILSQLTKLQARVLNDACARVPKKLLPNGLITAGDNIYGVSPGTSAYIARRTAEELYELTGNNDIHRIDCELDHLREIGLLTDVSGFFTDGRLEALIVPTTLAFQMFVRCQGSRRSPAEFFDLSLTPNLEDNPQSQST